MKLIFVWDYGKIMKGTDEVNKLLRSSGGTSMEQTKSKMLHVLEKGR
jgi:hypothetical protein